MPSISQHIFLFLSYSTEVTDSAGNVCLLFILVCSINYHLNHLCSYQQQQNITIIIFGSIFIINLCLSFSCLNLKVFQGLMFIVFFLLFDFFTGTICQAKISGTLYNTNRARLLCVKTNTHAHTQKTNIKTKQDRSINCNRSNIQTNKTINNCPQITTDLI